MKLYDKLKEKQLVDDVKDYCELIWMKAIKIDNIPIVDPNIIIDSSDIDIQIGLLSTKI